MGERLRGYGFETELLRPENDPDARHPRWNVIGTRRGAAARPCVHLNGHIDVVPAGEGWTLDPFGGVVRAGRLYGDLAIGHTCTLRRLPCLEALDLFAERRDLIRRRRGSCDVPRSRLLSMRYSCGHDFHQQWQLTPALGCGRPVLHSAKNIAQGNSKR